MLEVQSFEYFRYEVMPHSDGIRFIVRPAYGHPTQWGETWDSEWVQTKAQCLDFLDVRGEELDRLHYR